MKSKKNNLVLILLIDYFFFNDLSKLSSQMEEHSKDTKPS